jgi:hypothetical protein
MKKVGAMLPAAAGSLKVTPGPEIQEEDTRQKHERVDAVNQMFAEFELAYHNQFHKAWGTEGNLALAKKYWYSSLARFPAMVILKATRQVTTTQTFLPSLSTLVSACENSMSLFGLPSAREAYREACLAPQPKAEYQWSHPAVYLAGRACDWYTLASQTEDALFPLFEYHYKALCEKALNGQELTVPLMQALGESLPETALTEEQQRVKLQALKKALKF